MQERSFESIEKAFNEFFSMESKNSEESGQIKGKDVDILLVITFEQSCLGCISELTYLKNYWCTVC
jgi:DnaJ-class molecular chaperone